METDEDSDLSPTTTRQTETDASEEAKPPVKSSVREDFGALLRNPSFRTLLTAHFASNVGDWLAFVALFSVAAFDWQANVLDVSLLAVSYMLPFATVAPFAGVFVDRWDLRRVMIVSDLMRLVVVICMAYTTILPLMCVLLFVLQSLASFFNPAMHAAIPRLVDRRHILAANSLNTQAAHLTKILGPGVAGLLVAALGARGCLLFDAATFAISALLLLRLPLLPAVVSSAVHRSVGRDLRSGVVFLWNHGRLRAVTLMLALCICGLGAFIVVLPIFARDVLLAGARLLGFLLSGLGLGAVVGALLVAHTGKRWDKLASLIAASWLAAAALAVLSGTTQYSVAVGATFFFGARDGGSARARSRSGSGGDAAAASWTRRQSRGHRHRNGTGGRNGRREPRIRESSDWGSGSGDCDPSGSIRAAVHKLLETRTRPLISERPRRARCSRHHSTRRRRFRNFLGDGRARETCGLPTIKKRKGQDA